MCVLEGIFPLFPIGSPWLPMPPDHLLDQLVFGARSSKRHSEAPAHPWSPMVPNGSWPMASHASRPFVRPALFGTRSSKRLSEARAHLWCLMVSHGFQWQPSDYQNGPWFPMPPDHLLDQSLFGRGATGATPRPLPFDCRRQVTHIVFPPSEIFTTQVPLLAIHASRPLTLFGVYAGIILIDFFISYPILPPF